MPSTKGQSDFLVVTCGRAAGELGQVDDYDLVQLPALDAAVVVTTLDGTRRAWLLVKADEQVLMIEEITGTIAREAGRGVRANIDDLDLDFSDVRGRGVLITVGNRALGRAAQALDVAQLVRRARALRSQAAAASGQ